MRFLPFIKGQDFLIIYAIFSIIGIILIAKKISSKGNRDFIISPLDDDKYYVLKNSYNIYNLFYYVTYKLYTKGSLLRDEEEKKFYANNDKEINLSNIEQQVYSLYLEKFAPKDFKPTMINESYFKDYYEEIKNKLMSDGLIEDFEMVKKNKKFSNIGLFIILVPGIWRLIGGIVSEMPVTGLIMELFLITIAAKVVFLGTAKDKLTSKGEASISAYEKYYEIRKKEESEFNENNTYSMNIMGGFLMTNAWMYFLGVSSVNNNKSNFINNDSGSSCSSCSSGSSCSSCSSCGGCGGGN